MNALKRRVAILCRKHGDFMLLVVLFAAFRLMSIFFFQPGGYIRDYSDFTLYMGAASVTNEGYLPFIDFWLEYPPLFPWLFTGLYRLSLLIPQADDPRFWFYSMLSLVLVLFEIGNFILIYLTALVLQNRYRALRTATFYALLFFPVYVLSTDFDTIPLFFMLLGLYEILKERSIASGIALGIGFCIKVTPFVFVPVAIRVFAAIREKIKHGMAAVVTIIALSIPFFLLDAHLYLIPFRAAANRSSWETVWAVLEGYFSYGAVGGDRFDRTVSDFSIHPSSLPWLWISIAFGLVYLFFYFRPVDYEDKRKVLGLSTLTMALFMLYSKGYSPQFLVYLLPLILLYCPAIRAIAYAIALTVLNFLEQPIYFVMFPEQHWFFTGIVVFRAILLLTLVVEGALALFPTDKRTRKIWIQIVAVLIAVFVIWGARSYSILGQAYFDQHYQQENYRTAIEYLKEQAQEDNGTGILFMEQDTYQRVYPFLHKDMDLRLANTSRPQWSDNLEQWKSDHPRFWLWRGDVTDPDLETWLDKHTKLLASEDFDWGTTYLLSVRNRNP